MYFICLYIYFDYIYIHLLTCKFMYVIPNLVMLNKYKNICYPLFFKPFWLI